MLFGNCACQVKKLQFIGSTFYKFMIQCLHIHVSERIGAEFLTYAGEELLYLHYAFFPGDVHVVRCRVILQKTPEIVWRNKRG